MATRSRGVVAAAGLGAAVVAVYAVLGGIALTAPTVLSLPGFGRMGSAGAGIFTAQVDRPKPAHRTHVLAAVVSVPTAVAVPVANVVRDTTPAAHAPA